MAEDKIRKIAEKLVWTGGPYAAEKERVERILREELEGLMAAVQKHLLKDSAHSGVHLAAALAEYGWPWRKNGDTSQGRG